MRAELQILSPLVAVREVSFLRFCKQHADGVWAIVDVSVDGGLASSNCRRLPSGCLVQDMPNGYSKVQKFSPFLEFYVSSFSNFLLFMSNLVIHEKKKVKSQRRCRI